METRGNSVVRRGGLGEEWHSVADLVNMEIKDVPKLWDPFLPQTGVAGLTGTSDGGKSTLLRTLAIDVALGKTNSMGFPLNPRYNHAYYISTEDDVNGIAANLFKQNGVYKELRDCDRLHFLFNSYDIAEKLNKALVFQRADLVVIDTWADTFWSGSMNNLNDVRNDLTMYRDIARQHDCLVLILHHINKRSETAELSKTSLNGSGAVEQTLRSLLGLRRGASDSEKLLSILKSNYLSTQMKGHDFKLVFDEESLTYSGTGEFLASGNATNNRTIYDHELWFGRIKEAKKGLMSYKDCHELFKIRYPEEDIPSLTWFKTNCRVGGDDWENLDTEYE